MSRTTGQILKGSQLRWGEPVLLGGPTGPADGAPAARASVVRRDAGGATIEVVCGCGQVIRLHCAYGPQGQTTDTP